MRIYVLTQTLLVGLTSLVSVSPKRELVFAEAGKRYVEKEAAQQQIADIISRAEADSFFLVTVFDGETGGVVRNEDGRAEVYKPAYRDKREVEKKVIFQEVGVALNVPEYHTGEGMNG